MSYKQADLFAQHEAESNKLSDARRLDLLSRLETTLATLESATTFPWRDPLDAVHEENRFERDTEILGEEGRDLWVRFDREMERLYASRFPGDESSVQSG